ncbi:MAG: hypothetical protein WBQ48_08815 [Aeromicrobium sp.]
MLEPFEASILDDTALDEIEMTTRLMIAASACPRRLSQCEVDQILGVASAN